jgi:DNA polymerase-3 subunit delta'
LIYPWQKEVWTRLLPWRQDAPHAILLAGPAGIGKLDFARELARFWLCEKPLADAACGVCPSCIFVALGHHPDLQAIRPEAVALLEGADAEEGEGSGEDAVDGAQGDTEKRSSRAPSRDIRIGQIQALIESLSIGTHRSGRRIALIYPAESMNLFTANALLKILEEPPADNHVLLVSDAPERLLPTILSRCQKLVLPAPALGEARQWLQGEQVEDAEGWLAEAGGAPLAALRAAHADSATLEARHILLDGLARGARCNVQTLADRLAKAERPVVVAWLQRWVWDCLAYRLGARIRYYPKHQVAIAALARQLDPVELARFARELSATRRAAEHPLNARLFFEDLLLRYLRSVAPSVESTT